MAKRVLGILGGSGVYDIDGLTNAEWKTVETPWGAPSDQILTGQLNGVDLAFLPRHGRGHVHTPTSVPYRANIAALKMLGVTDLLAVSATGSFREDRPPGDFILLDQFIDRTKTRPPSFFDTGCVAHVSLAHPTCTPLGGHVTRAAKTAGVPLHIGGTYLAMEGPQFSTLAESRLYRDVWGCDVIGMTNMPEAKLAREAEICYAAIAMVTDFDCWHPDHDAVDVTQIVATLTQNATKARALITALTTILPKTQATCPQGCSHALDTAMITHPDKRDPDLVAKLRSIAGRVLP